MCGGFVISLLGESLPTSFQSLFLLTALLRVLSSIFIQFWVSETEKPKKPAHPLTMIVKVVTI